MSAPMLAMDSGVELLPAHLGILQKLVSAIQQGEQMAAQGRALAEQTRSEVETFLKMCAADLGVDYPAAFDFKMDRFVPKS
jgi:hypothetical protein